MEKVLHRHPGRLLPEDKPPLQPFLQGIISYSFLLFVSLCREKCIGFVSRDVRKFIFFRSSHFFCIYNEYFSILMLSVVTSFLFGLVVSFFF